MVSSHKEYQIYPNLLLTTSLTGLNQIWMTDFTFIWFHDRFIYVATVMDIWNREIVGYQESFCDKFKIDLGDLNRFETLGELVYEIYHTIHIYNKTRIHTALKMSPREFAKKSQPR